MNQTIRSADRVIMQSAAGATGAGTSISCTDVVGGREYATFQIVGTFTATVTWQATIDGTNWIAVQATNLNAGTAATTATGEGLFRIVCAGLTAIRANITAYISGSITVTGVVTA